MKNRLMLGITALSLSTLMISGCGLFDKDNKNPDDPPVNVDKTDLPDVKNPPDPKQLELVLPNDSLGKFSAGDVKEAQTVAQEYIIKSLTTPELLSGRWWEKGHNLEKFTTLGKFSQDLKDDITNLNPTTGLGAQTTQSLALFLAPSEDITSVPECVNELKNCSGKPFFGAPEWKAVNDKVIQVKVTASVTRDVIQDKRTQQVLDTYNYSLGMSKEDNGWVINQIQNSYTIGKFTEE